MILAAGVGSRLKPLTDRTPKALIDVGGRTLLEITLDRLKSAGVTEAVVNVFHHADQVCDFIHGRDFGMRVEVSRETGLLDTGGGLKKASWFFDDGKPFLLHNVDILTDVDLRGMLEEHRRRGSLATLAVMARESSRALLFDGEGRLRGRRRDGLDEWWGPAAASAEALAFIGIHVIAPEIFPLLTETGAFPIAPAYLRLAGEGRPIGAFRADAARWININSLERLEAAKRQARR